MAFPPHRGHAANSGQFADLSKSRRSNALSARLPHLRHPRCVTVARPTYTVAILIIVPPRAARLVRGSRASHAGTAHPALIFHAFDFRHHAAISLCRRGVVQRRRVRRAESSHTDADDLGAYRERLGTARLLDCGARNAPDAPPPGRGRRRMPIFLPRPSRISSRQLVTHCPHIVHPHAPGLAPRFRREFGVISKKSPSVDFLARPLRVRATINAYDDPRTHPNRSARFIPMRLTLRTLLAYLDDVLDPVDKEELAQKDSVQRIRGRPGSPHARHCPPLAAKRAAGCRHRHGPRSQHGGRVSRQRHAARTGRRLRTHLLGVGCPPRRSDRLPSRAHHDFGRARRRRSARQAADVFDRHGSRRSQTTSHRTRPHGTSRSCPCSGCAFSGADADARAAEFATTTRGGSSGLPPCRKLVAIDGRGGRTRRNRADRNHGSLREWIAWLVRQQVGGTATDGAEYCARPGRNGRERAARRKRRQWNPPITPP